MKTSMRPGHREGGLTLLEVLAAAMIFAMVMTVLIGTSSSAVRHVGLSSRRLEANLVADAVLADLEIQMKQGIAPEIEEGESVRDQFAIRVSKTDLVSDSDGGDPTAFAGIAGIDTDAIAMLGSGLPEVARHLKQYDIEVSWLESNGPETVTRTTFAFDWQTAAVELSDLFERRGRTEGTGLGDEDDATEDERQTGRAEEEDCERSPLAFDGHNARNRALNRDCL